MKKYHTWMETWKTGFPLSDRGAKLKVYSLIMGDTPLLWKRYSYINLSKMWWKNLVVVSPRLVRTCLTSDTRNKHWFAWSIATKYHQICGSANSEMTLQRLITFFRWCRQTKAGIVSVVVVGATVRGRRERVGGVGGGGGRGWFFWSSDFVGSGVLGATESFM